MPVCQRIQLALSNLSAYGCILLAMCNHAINWCLGTRKTVERHHF